MNSLPDLRAFSRLAPALTVLLVLSACSRAAGRSPELQVSPTPATFTPSALTPAPGGTSPLATGSPAVTREVPGATPSPFPPADPSPTQAPPARTRYQIEVGFDYDRKRASVAQVVQYTNPSPRPLDKLLLIVDPNRFPGALELQAVQIGTGEGPANFSLIDNELRIPIDPPLPSGGEITLALSYTLSLPERSGAFGYTPIQANLGDWYAFVPPLDEEGTWLRHRPWGHGEHLVYDVADFEVLVRLSGPTADSGALKVAASAPPNQGEGVLRYRLEAARSFALSLSPHYLVTRLDTPYGAVTGYSFPEHRRAGEAAVQTAAQALELYSQLFGPYAHPELSLVEASFGDGMEYEGLVFVSQGFYLTYDGTPRNYLTLLSAHETAHQWWYGQVGNDQALEPWLDEALATFCELLYYERYHPEDVPWWWLFRVQIYGPQGEVGGSIYDYAGFRPYVNAVYLRGAQFLDAVRGDIGEAALLAFLKDYAARYALRQATGDQFLSLLEEHTGEDLSPLIQAYFSP